MNYIELDKEMLEFKPELKVGFIKYFRYEENGHYIVIFNSDNLVEQLVNESFIIIMEQFNGKNSINDVIQFIMNRYTGLTIDLVTKDVVFVVQKIIGMQGFKPNVKNPFLKDISIKIDEEYTMYLANYTHLGKIISIAHKAKFFESDKNKQFIGYINPFIDIDMTSPVELVQNAMNKKDCLFIIEKNGITVGTILFNNISNTVTNLEYCIFDKDITIISICFNYAITTMSKMSSGNIKCFRTYFLPNNNNLLKSCLKEIGFTKTIVLKDELGKSADVEEFSCYV